MTAELFRDAWGVPHVRASDELELAEAQGRVTAHDRAWQIETDRWRAEGRLAEHVGAAGLAWDRFARQARLADTARRAYDALGDDDRTWVDAYVRGVNTVLGSVPPPVEVEQLDARFGGRVPFEPWPAWMPLGVLLVAHALFSTFPRVLWHDHVARTLGPDAVALFDGSRADGTEAGGAPTSGSNAWALHGSRTASGFPLLAGDPHRLLELPGVYQQVRLACDAYDVVGLAFPGVPGVQHFGQTASAAWGITNAMAHSAEVARERLRSVGSTVEALGPDGWEPVHRHDEVVRVRGGDDVRVEVVETAHGVVLTGARAGSGTARAPGLGTPGAGSTAGAAPDEAPRDAVVDAVSLRLPARVDADLGFACLRPLLRSRTALDVADALRGWVDPVNRVLAADTGGTVLSLTVGRVPTRSPDERRLPLDASTDAARPVPWRALPGPVPVVDVAVDANERPTRPGIALGHVYAPPHRAHRIAALLDAQADRPLGPGDLAAIHGDTLLGGADRLLTWVEEADGLSDAASSVRAVLLAWDRRMDAGSTAAGAFAAWRSALVARLAAHPALAPLHAPHGHGEVLDPWFSVAARVADALPVLLASAAPDLDASAHVRAALEDVAARTPGPWGERHRVVASHVLDDVPGCDPPALPDVPLAGDADCVRCTGSTPSVTDRAWRGSVARWVWDLADRERSRWGVPFGASGDPRSAHHHDQHETWVRAETVEVVTDWARLAREDLP